MPGAPLVTQQPTNQAVTAGGAVTFTASASGTPTPTVQWSISIDGGNTWSPIAGATSDSYNFQTTESQEVENRGLDEYEAVFTNSFGTATTNPATLYADLNSNTWSGDVDLGGTYSAVSGDWTVPNVACDPPFPDVEYQWLGIDGWGSPTVEQVGTGVECSSSGQEQYFAWYELYGTGVNNGDPIDPGYPNIYPVSAGDDMSASVSVVNGAWTLTETNLTANWTFSFSYSSLGITPYQHSAEWVYENPPVEGGSLTSLADFGSTSFTNCMVTENGVGSSMISPTSSFNTIGIFMSMNNRIVALPGTPNSSGTGFTDTWQNIGSGG